MNHWTRQLQSFSCENYLPRQLCTAIPIRCDKSPIAIPINHDLFHLSFLLLLKKNFCVWVFVLLFLGILLFHHRSCCRFFPYKMCSWDVGTETRERKKEKKCFIEENFGKRISFFIVLFVESFIYFTFSSSCCVDFMLFWKKFGAYSSSSLHPCRNQSKKQNVNRWNAPNRQKSLRIFFKRK